MGNLATCVETPFINKTKHGSSAVLGSVLFFVICVFPQDLMVFLN